MDGIVIVDKPTDWTSQDVTAKLRGVFQTRRIGHGGTLDPMATGVLPVFVGRATRAVEFFEHAEKTYEAVLRLGITTDTEDITGTVLSEKAPAVSESEFLAALEHFRGEIQQIPPMYSAIKVNGQKLCDLARKGREVERKSRTITIHQLTCLEFTGTTARLLVHCSKGTYIRTLCHDLGQLLGCGGCMAALRRTMAAGYTLAESHTLEEAQAQGETLLRPVDTLFRQYDAYHIQHPRVEQLCRNGNAFTVKDPPADGLYRVYGMEGDFLCLSRLENGRMTSIKNFFGA